MSYFGSIDFFAEVAKGNIPGHSLVHKFGRNTAVPNGEWELIANLSAATAFLSAATTVRVKAGGDAADTSGGAGAGGILISGVNDSLAFASETLTTAGASASSNSTGSYWRLARGQAVNCGTYATPVNTGAIVIENSAGGTDLLQIDAGEGQTQLGAYAVATGYDAYLIGYGVSIDSQKKANFRMFVRENFNDTTPPVNAKQLRKFFDGVDTPLDTRLVAPEYLGAGPMDVWWEAYGDGGTASVSVQFGLLLVATS